MHFKTFKKIISFVKLHKKNNLNFNSFKIFIIYKDGKTEQSIYSDSIKVDVFKKIVEQNVLGTMCRKAEYEDYIFYLKDLEYKLKNPLINPYIYIDIDGKKIELESSKIISGRIIYE